MLGVSLTTTAVGLLGGLGVLPSAADDPGTGASLASEVALDPVGRTDTEAESAQPGDDTGPASSQQAVEPEESSDAAAPTETEEPVEPAEPVVQDPAVPPSSGQGRRVVFSESEQRVWLVGDDDEVQSTYLVSGSLTDNLQPGTYDVFSRSEDAYGIDDSGTMKWFVRFTRGPSGAAIGFHTIPIDDGVPVQTKAQLGTEQSHGCIRQKTKDALRMWDFAPIGTTVVVV